MAQSIYDKMWESQKKKIDDSYADVNTQLDNQQNDVNQQVYNDRNTAALNNAQNVQRIRDYMAKNNLLQSGESADAYMRANTDYSNNMGNIKTNETKLNKSILDQRNSAQREQASKLLDLQSQIEQQKQAAAQAAVSRAASAARSSTSSSQKASQQVDSDYKSALSKIMEMKKSTVRRKVGVDDFGKPEYDYVPNYSSEDIVNYVQALGLPEEYTYRLLDATGIEPPVVTTSTNPNYNPSGVGYRSYSSSR